MFLNSTAALIIIAVQFVVGALLGLVVAALIRRFRLGGWRALATAVTARFPIAHPQSRMQRTSHESDYFDSIHRLRESCRRRRVGRPGSAQKVRISDKWFLFPA